MADYRLVEAIRSGHAEWTKIRETLDETDLRGANFVGADLQFTDLSGLDLLGVSFDGSRLRMVDLTSADLTNATFRGASISTTIFDSAELTNVDFTAARILMTGGRDIERGVVRFRDSRLRNVSFASATITGADFSNASLYEVVFENAALTDVLFDDTTFRQISFGGTHFAGIDFSSVDNLDSASHSSPSLLSPDTIRRSGGAIPIRFLRGCGLSEVEIVATQLMQDHLSAAKLTEILYEIMDTYGAKPVQLKLLFISYSHADRVFVDAICAKLDANGVRYWRDSHSLKAGRLETQIARGISLNPTVLIVLSQQSVASDWVEWEVATARDVEKKLGRDVLCPIAIDDAWRSSKWPGTLRRQIEDYNVLDFSRWREPTVFDEQWLKLLGGLTLYY